MHVDFWKMHGAGNDFVVVDERAGSVGFTPALVTALADRRTGIGCDQFITIEAPVDGEDAFMRIRNPDGGEAGACGNAARCVVSLLAAESGRRQVTLRTVAGLLPSERLADGRVAVDMGVPEFDWRNLPLSREADTLHLPLPGDPAGLAIGNPHATFFVTSVEAVDIAMLGPRFEYDRLFPERANIGFAEIRDGGRIRLRVWERGAGLTLACGSGACAALVNAHRRGLVGRAAAVEVDGGVLEIAWRDDGHVLMTGPVALAYRGRVELGAFPS